MEFHRVCLAVGESNERARKLYESANFYEVFRNGPVIKLACDLGSYRAVLQHNNGVQLEVAGNVDGAVECYRRSTELDPSIPNSFVTLGRILRDRGKASEAEDCFRGAYNTVGVAPEKFFELGRAFFDEGIVDEAEACLLEVN